MNLRTLFSTIALITAFTVTGCTNTDEEYINPDVPDDIRVKLESKIASQEEILKTDPENTDAMITIGLNYQLLGDLRSAEKQYLKVLEINPSHIAALNNIADVHEKMENYEQAAEYISKLHQLKPGYTEGIRDTVRILLKADRPDDAETALENYVKSSESTPENRTQISNLYQSIYDYRQTH